VVHLLVSDGDLTKVRFAFSFGFLLGMLVVPEIDRQAFARPLVLQVPAGILAGTLFMAYLTANPWFWAMGSLFGGVVGWQARRLASWLKF